MIAASTWPRNRLLLALPARSLKQVIPDLRHIECKREQVLLDADSSLDHIYFPDSGVVSVVAGREGGTGFQAVFGAKTFLGTTTGPGTRYRRKDVATGVQARSRYSAWLSQSHARSCARISRASNDVGSLQRRAQSQSTAGAVAPHDARPP